MFKHVECKGATFIVLINFDIKRSIESTGIYLRILIDS